MLQDLFFGQENTRSLLILDNFENEGNALLFSLLKHYLNNSQNNIELFTANYHLFDCYSVFFKEYINIHIHDTFCKQLFNKNINTNENNDLITQHILKNIRHDNEKKTILVIDNANLLLANYNNPFKLMHFMQNFRKNREISAVIMLLHEDSINESYLNQIIYSFQTILNVIDLNASQNYKYLLKIIHRNFKNGKTTQTDENLTISNELKIENIQKIVKSKNHNIDDQDAVDPTKNLTFNLSLKDDELEAKKNLVLPYELINNKPELKISGRQSVKSINQQQNEGKIFYEPDERDDFDDEDPDDDLNF